METNIYKEFQNALVLALAAGRIKEESGTNWSNAITFEIVEAEKNDNI